MQVKLHTFQKHTEIHWLSKGHAIKRFLDQRAYMMLGTKEKLSSELPLNLSVIPIFERTDICSCADSL